MPMCQPVPGPAAHVAKSSVLSGQTALQPGHSSHGCVLSLDQSRARGVPQGALQILAPVLVKLCKRELDGCSKLSVVGCSKRLQERSFFVVDVAYPTRNPRVEHARFDGA